LPGDDPPEPPDAGFARQEATIFVPAGR